MQEGRENIALIGLGAMGSRMAEKILEAGHALTVYNRTPEKAQALVEAGASLAESPRAAAESAGIVISMVTDDAVSQQIWLDEDLGALAGLQPGALAIESSTLTVDWVDTLNGMMNERGVDFLDAPVVGSRPQAEAGKLVYLVGGSESALLRARSVLELMGGILHHVGATGQGMLMKLVVNAYFGVQVAALGELLGLVGKSELATGRAVEILTSLPIMSPALQGIAGAMQASAFAPLFPIDLVEKDLGYAVDVAQALEADLPAISAARGSFAEARQLGFGDDNISGVVQVFTQHKDEG